MNVALEQVEKFHGNNSVSPMKQVLIKILFDRKSKHAIVYLKYRVENKLKRVKGRIFCKCIFTEAV